jgi:hypothetical protein
LKDTGNFSVVVDVVAAGSGTRAFMIVCFAFWAPRFAACFAFKHIPRADHSLPSSDSCNPDSAADVRGSDVESRNNFPSSIIPRLGQVREHAAEVSMGAEKSDDVFEEDKPRLDTSNDFDCCRPLVFRSSSGCALAGVLVVCEGKFLARKARRYHVSHSFVTVSISS